MHRTIRTRVLALVLGAIAAVGLVSVPAGSSPTIGRQCLKVDTAGLEPGRDYEVFPHDVDRTMQSLHAAFTRRDSQPVLASAKRSTAPVDYVVVPDDLDATMQSLQGALAQREIAQHRSVTLVPC
jgi:hypothetical protein